MDENDLNVAHKYLWYNDIIDSILIWILQIFNKQILNKTYCENIFGSKAVIITAKQSQNSHKQWSFSPSFIACNKCGILVNVYEQRICLCVRVRVHVCICMTHHSFWIRNEFGAMHFDLKIKKFSKSISWNNLTLASLHELFCEWLSAHICVWMRFYTDTKKHRRKETRTANYNNNYSNSNNGGKNTRVADNQPDYNWGLMI